MGLRWSCGSNTSDFEQIFSLPISETLTQPFESSLLSLKYCKWALKSSKYISPASSNNNENLKQNYLSKDTLYTQMPNKIHINKMSIL